MAEIEYKLETQFDLEKHLAKWINILNLNDWEIKIHFREGMNLCGQVSYQTMSKRAVISIMPFPEYLSRDFDFLWDMEATVVHELLHVKFSEYFCYLPKKLYKKALRMDERMVNDMVKILIAQERARNVSS